MNRTVYYLLSTVCWLLMCSAAARAQESLFYFSAKPTFDADFAYQKNIEVRPNSTSGLFVFVKGPKELNKATVELWSPEDKDKPWMKSAPLKFEQAGQIARVQFPKVEEKKAAAPEAVPATAPATATPPPPPPPPGKMLSLGKQNGAEVSRSFKFKLVLIEERDNRPGEKWTEEVAVSVIGPDRYLDVKASSTPNSIEVKVSAKNDDTAKKAFINGKPSIVTLVFPPQPDLDSAGLGAGTYRRAVAEPGASVTLNAVDLPIQTRQRETAKIRFYVEADGYPRGFIYQPTLTQFERGELQLDSTAKVRVYPGNLANESPNGTYYARPVAKPTDRYPVRVELDNPVTDARVDFVFNRSSAAAATDNPAKDEAEVLAGPRETKVWLDPAGEEGQFIITNQCRDWLVQLDTYMLRGAHSLSASFKNGAAGSDDKSVVLALDDTPPNRIEILLEDVHVKGLPLRVDAMVADKETPIKRVIFFVGPPPGPDGKRAAEPIKVEGVQDKAKPALWHGELPLAPEAKGVMQVGVTAMNEVGLEATETKTIKLVDAPLPAGDIVVKVMRGDRPQPAVAVGLKDAENKEKSVGTTDDKGIVKFEKLPPGLYMVLTAKPDSSSGTKASAPVKVEAGKTVEVILPLKRGP